MTPTNKLRWVKSENPTTPTCENYMGDTFKLQQWWHYASNVISEPVGDWRDIETEEEA